MWTERNQLKKNIRLKFIFLTVIVFSVAYLILFKNEFVFYLSSYSSLTEENSKKLNASVEKLK